MFKQQQVYLVILALIAIISMVLSAGTSLQHRGNMKHPELDNHCFFAEHNLTIPLKETVFPTNLMYTCVRVTCLEDYVLELKYCEKITPKDKCEYSKPDYSKPYPECCETIICGDKA